MTSRAHRAQVLAAAAEVFARTAITPAALAELARMSKAEIIEELIAHHMEQTFTLLRQGQAAPRPLLENLIDAVPESVARDPPARPGAVGLEVMAGGGRHTQGGDAPRRAAEL